MLLPNGKPDIRRWNKENLTDYLSEFVDNKKELDTLVKGIMDYISNIENRNVESLSAMNHKFKRVCNQHSDGEQKGVDLCPKGKNAAKKGLLFVIHNHPSNNPLQSYGDLIAVAKYNVKYNIVFTEENGLFIIKNKGADMYDIKRGWDDITQKMTEHFKLNNPDSYNEEYEKYFSGKISRKKLKQNIRDKVIEHMGDNLPVSIETYDECLSKYNIDVLRVKP